MNRFPFILHYDFLVHNCLEYRFLTNYSSNNGSGAVIEYIFVYGLQSIILIK